MVISHQVAISDQLLAGLEGFTLCGWGTAALSRAELADVVRASEAHGEDALRVSSCQRVEVYRQQGCACGAPVRLTGVEALAHLAEVAAGLHSVVLGEAQVMGQVRSAVSAAPARLQELVGPAIAAARSLRAETTFSAHTGHLIDRALHLAEIPMPARVGVVGVGSVGRLAAERSVELGASEVVVFGRRRPEGSWVDAWSYEFRPLATLATSEPFDLLVTCLGSSASELDGRRDLPPVRQLIVDLGTPRNVSNGPETRVLCISEMLEHEQGQRHGRDRRQALGTRLREILERRLEMNGETATSPVGQLRLEVERVRQAELARIGRLHPELPAETMDQVTQALVNQIFHLPSQRLRQMQDSELGARLVALFARPAEEEAIR